MNEKINFFLNLIEEKISEIYYNGDAPSLYEPIKYSLENKGKRIRPVLLLVSYSLFKKDIERAIEAAIGIEMFHNFTLIHDDIMDNSLYRRNKPTVHSKWNINTAILSGDAMMIKSIDYFTNYNSRLLKEFLHTAIKVCEGQQLDLDYEKKEEISLDEYVKMIRLKTAELIAFSLKAGGIIGNAPENYISNLYELGVNLGIAFQIQDDFLDLFGDFNTFGKNIGQDIAEAKKTILYVMCLKSLNNTEKKLFIDYYNNKNIEFNEKVLNIKKIYKDNRIDELVSNLLKEYSERINSKIKSLENCNNLNLLTYLINKILSREK